MMKQNAIIQTLSKPLLFATFFMAFPVFTIVQNVSFFFLAYFYYKINAVTPQLLKVKTLMGVTAVFMVIAAFISTINAGISFEIDNFMNAVKVLPNYTYWGVLIIFLGNVFFRFSSYDELGKMVFFGVCANVVGKYILNPILNFLPFYSPGSQNSFAFQLIIFAPIASSYLHKKYNNYFYTYSCINRIATSKNSCSAIESAHV